MEIKRHLTAIRRNKLSLPVQAACKDGYISSENTFFDYGCGLGDDVRILKSQGIDAEGWDPTHFPSSTLRESDVVNLGYVVNVIEDLEEREEVLRQAWSLTKTLLIVSARPKTERKSLKTSTPFEDGIVTSKDTFQKFYDRQELGDWIESVLGDLAMYAGRLHFRVFK